MFANPQTLLFTTLLATGSYASVIHIPDNIPNLTPIPAGPLPEVGIQAITNFVTCKQVAFGLCSTWNNVHTGGRLMDELFFINRRAKRRLTIISNTDQSTNNVPIVEATSLECIDASGAVT